MTRKLTLGLMVFFLGVLMAACGSKKSSAPNVNNNNGGNTNTGGNVWTGDGNTLPSANNCGASCTVYLDGTYNVTNPNLYASSFGYNNGGNTSNPGQIPFPTYQNGQWNFGGFTNGLVNCGLGAGLTYLFTELFGGTNQFGCSLVQQQQITQPVNLASSYPASMQMRLVQQGSSYQLHSAVAQIRNGFNGGNGDIVEFRPTADQRVLGSADGRFMMQNNGNGQFIMGTANGQEFGRFNINQRGTNQ